MSPKDKFRAEAEQLQEFLEEEAEEVSRLSKFVQRASKLTGAMFAKTLILGWLRKPEATLNELAQTSDDLGVEISAPGLHQRINAFAVSFMTMLFSRAIARFRRRQALPGEVLEQFESINIADATTITLPAALSQYFANSGTPGAEAGLKIQLSFDYLHGQMNAIEVTEGKRPDQSCSLPAQAAPNSLNIFDLGYFKFSLFATLARLGAFFISRFQHRTHFYANETDAKPINLLTFLAQFTQDRIEVHWYLGDELRLPVRVLFERLPKEVAEERRRKAKAKARKKGRTLSKRHLALLGWSFLMTNVPAHRLSFEQVFVLYRIRWQIELLFKLWKSQAKLAEVGNMRFERVMCQLFARLIALVLFHWLVAPVRVIDDAEISLPKAFQVLQRHALRLLDSIAQDWHTTAQVLADLASAFSRFTRKDKRKKRPSTYRQLIDCQPAGQAAQPLLFGNSFPPCDCAVATGGEVDVAA